MAICACDACGGEEDEDTRPPSSESEPAPEPEPPAPEPGLTTFEDAVPGQLPAELSAWTGEWQVLADDGAPSGAQVLAQHADNPSPVFNLVVREQSQHTDVEVSVRLRAREGHRAQGGGVVWRARDAENYYAASYNPLEDTLRAYRVEDGRPEPLASADIRIDGDAWHTLRCRMKDTHIECFLNGHRHLDVQDDTFGEAGMVGLWAKADAETHFDDLRVRGLDRTPVDAALVGEIMGTGARTTDDGVTKVTWSRDDVAVRVDGMRFPPAAGLTSWAGFAPAEGGAMVMGDTVVFEDEVDAAMDAAFAQELQVTALHNHFFFDEPKVYFMHIGGHGTPRQLARGVHAMWSAIRALREKRPEPAARFDDRAPEAGGTLDARALGGIVGADASVKAEGVVKVVIPREARMHGARFGGSMGLSSWAAFTGSDQLAAMDGDFAMTAGEVQPVLRALRKADIHVVALHNHMLNEQPAYYFAHFWAKGPAAQLARGFRAALDAQRTSARTTDR